MKSNMKYIIKLIAMLIIVLLSLVFTLLTLETVYVEGENYTYCRKVEFWCYKSSATPMIYELTDEDKYTKQWTNLLYDITVENGQFKKYDSVFKTNALDGHYEEISGYFDYDEETEETLFIVSDDKHKIIGALR